MLRLLKEDSQRAFFHSLVFTTSIVYSEVKISFLYSLEKAQKLLVPDYRVGERELSVYTRSHELPRISW